MSVNVFELVSELTVREKAELVSGADWWRTKAVERLGIPSVFMSDGPHGLRTIKPHAGEGESVYAVCFPAACATTSSFDAELLTALGETLGDECIAEDVSTLLGPAANIKRSPLCGRNFEYMSEDPYLASRTAAAFIDGVQSKGICVSLKHFAANNQEYVRFTVDERIGERALREIYLAAFEYAVKSAKPGTIMCSYNKINGVHSSQNKWLLTDVLRGEWGYDGIVMSDWGAVDDRVEGVKAGLDLEMPYSGAHNADAIENALKNGTLRERDLDKCVTRMLEYVFKHTSDPGEYDKDAHHALAADFAAESAVLLKNSGALPLKKSAKTAFIGGFAEKPRYQGGGSSHINSYKVTSALDAVKSRGLEVTYAPGFPADDDAVDNAAFAEAVKAAQNAENVVIFAGLPEKFESEGYDRRHMRLPDCQNALIEKLAAINNNITVVLHNGAPVEMPWIDKVSAVLELYLGGQAVGEAAARLLYGETNPSGKLAETFPIKLEDNPSYLNFPGDGLTVDYAEGIFVGYRYYDKKNMEVLFPFGHGLSYTTFEYSNLRVERDGERFKVRADVTNTGKIAGKEVVQLYVGAKRSAVIRPVRELKGYSKLALEPGETKTAEFTLSRPAFAYWEVGIRDWYAPSGEYELSIGSSSRDIRLTAAVEVDFETPPTFKVDYNTTPVRLLRDPRTSAAAEKRLAETFKYDPKAIKGALDYEGWNTFEGPIRTMWMMNGKDKADADAFIEEMNGLLAE